MIPLEQLREYLRGRPRGPVRDEDHAALVRLMSHAWPEFDGSEEEGMDSVKLARMERPCWDPPVLTFRIERHGAMVAGGSSRAEMQTWTVDVDKAEVDVAVSGYRQIEPMAPRLDVKPLVAEIVSLIEAGQDDERLKWSADRSRVTVRTGRILPPAYKRTMEGRRQRFGDALREAMTLAGWRPVIGTSPNTWERVPTPPEAKTCTTS